MYRGGDKMTSLYPKERNMSLPYERHNTAAWANINKTKPVSGVTIPDEVEVMNAKEWVDSNQK